MRVLTANWGSMNRVSPEKSEVVTGEESAAKDEAAAKEAKSEKTLLDQPLFIYVTDGSRDGAHDKIEDVVLDANDVLIGMKFFKCVKMSPDAVKDDPLLDGRSKDDRYFLLVSRDLEKITVVDGSKMKSKNVFKAMDKHARRDLATKFKKNVKEVQKLLLDFDKINNARKVLEEKKQRTADDKGKLKKIEKELEELAEAQKEADQKRDELLKVEVKKSA